MLTSSYTSNSMRMKSIFWFHAKQPSFQNRYKHPRPTHRPSSAQPSWYAPQFDNRDFHIQLVAHPPVIHINIFQNDQKLNNFLCTTTFHAQIAMFITIFLQEYHEVSSFASRSSSTLHSIEVTWSTTFYFFHSLSNAHYWLEINSS